MQLLKIVLPTLLCSIIIGCDGGGDWVYETGEENSSIANQGPEIASSPDSYDIIENQPFSLSIAATDPDGDSLTYELEGVDSQLFSISSSGELTLNRPFNFESPEDSDQDNIYSLTVVVYDSATDYRKNLSMTVINDPSDDSQHNAAFACNKAYYLDEPPVTASDAAHRYYQYYWHDAPQLCVNFFETELLEDVWEAKVVNALMFAKDHLPLLTPLNVFIVDQKNSSAATLMAVDTAACDLGYVHAYDEIQDCYATRQPWGNRSALGGVSHRQLPNGAELFFYRNNWSEETLPGLALRTLMHEFYHVYQHSMIFYFEDSANFGIPVRWEDEPEAYLGRQDFITVFPNWLEEGGANFAAYALSAGFDDSIDVQGQFIVALDEAKNIIAKAADNGDTLSLADYEFQGSLYESTDNPNSGIARELGYQRSGGSIALLYLWSLDHDNFSKITVDYYKVYAEKDNLDPGQGWQDAFEDLFAMTLTDFYLDFDAFMLEDKEQQLAIFKSNQQMRDASWSGGEVIGQ